LRGKHKPVFSPHLDTGDFVVVINAEKVRLTGKKETQKEYFRHTGYPGGGKFVNAAEMRAKHPERIIEHAVKGMLPKGPLGRQQFKKLKVYAGPDHPHEAQQPQPLTL
jgi:large subunit ribosomal protein L13